MRGRAGNRGHGERKVKGNTVFLLQLFCCVCVCARVCLCVCALSITVHRGQRCEVERSFPSASFAFHPRLPWQWVRDVDGEFITITAECQPPLCPTNAAGCLPQHCLEVVAASLHNQLQFNYRVMIASSSGRPEKKGRATFIIFSFSFNLISHRYNQRSELPGLNCDYCLC